MTTPMEPMDATGPAELDRGASADLLHGLLVETAAAHGAYEAAELGGVYDEDWPSWYARHLADDVLAAGYRIVRSRA